MKKSLLIITVVIASSVVICCYFFVNNLRYVTSNGGGGKIYLIDKKTGETSLIKNNRKVLVTSGEIPKVSKNDESRALSLAKWGHQLDTSVNNYDCIIERLKNVEGDFTVEGWKAVKFDSENYLVTHIYETSSGEFCIAFEVKLELEIVRLINENEELMKKYGL